MNTLSVLIPFYNESAACLLLVQDVLKQKIPEDWELEIVVCDDGSSFINPELSFFSNKKLKYITHPKNKGLSAARNTTIKHAKGSYFLFLDADIRLENTSVLASYIKRLEAGAQCINAPILFKGNSILNQYQNKAWRNNILKSACGLCLPRKHIKKIFNEKINHFGFEDKIFIFENNLHTLNPELLQNQYITHFDKSSLETVLLKFQESGKFGSPVLRQYYPSLYKSMSYSQLDKHSENFNKLSLLLPIAFPFLKIIIKLKKPWLFNLAFPLLTAHFYAQGCKQSL